MPGKTQRDMNAVRADMEVVGVTRGWLAVMIPDKGTVKRKIIH